MKSNTCNPLKSPVENLCNPFQKSINKRNRLNGIKRQYSRNITGIQELQRKSGKIVYLAQISIDGATHGIGCFPTVQQARLAYKLAKESFK